MGYARLVIDEWKCDADGCLAIVSRPQAKLALGAQPEAVTSLPAGWWALAVNSGGYHDTVRYYCPSHTPPTVK